MEGKQKVLGYRERLDKTLASQVLVDEDSIRDLVKNQLLRSSPSDTHGYIEHFIEKRSVEVSNFLDMLRSASRNDGSVPTTHGKPHGDWKLKQDNEDYRVMYREGPQGTPFHTLLVEGYVDGPVDASLCLSWEAALYLKWWPQFTIPPFKIDASKCVQKIRIGEQICLVRMKVPWPVSAREALLHYFELEYFQDDLIIVLLSSVSDIESIDKLTHGFTNDGIPEAKDIVRIGLVGGFALQKVTPNRSYFRTIATMDLKLDFVPPSLINFISRQLIGSGFKLYKKAVASIAKGDEDFGKALEDPLYVRVREGLSHENKFKKILKQEEAIESEKTRVIYPEESAPEILQADSPVTDRASLSNHFAVGTPEGGTQVIDQMLLGENESEKPKAIYPEESAPEILQADSPVTDCTSLSNHFAVGTPEDGTQVIDQMLLGENESEKPKVIYPEKSAPEILAADSPVADCTSLSNHFAVGTPEDGTKVVDRMLLGEIEEEGMERKTHLNQNGEGMDYFSPNLTPEKFQVNRDKKVFISPEVEHALNILDNVISTVRGAGLATQAWPKFCSSKQELNLERVTGEVGTSSSEDGYSFTICLNAPKVDNMDRASDEIEKGSQSPDIRHNIQDSPLREVNHNQIAPASPNKSVNDLKKSLEHTRSSYKNGITAEAPMLNNTSKDFKEAALVINGIHENIAGGGEKCMEKKKKMKKKQRHCCFFPRSSVIFREPFES